MEEKMMAMRNKSIIKCGFIVLMALFTGVLFAFPSASPAAQTVWRLDFYLPKGDPETVMLQQAADDILYFTEGRLKIDIYPSFSLKLNPRTQLKNLKDGLMEAACMNVEMLEGLEPSFVVTEAPGVWAGKADQVKAVTAMEPFKQKVYAEHWGGHYVATKMMTVQTSGIFSAKKPIKSIADLKGMKMRIPTRRMLNPFKELGVAPVNMRSGEVYMALKTGVLDGAASGSRILIYQKWAEVVKYGLEGQLTGSIAQDIVINQKAWDSVSDDIKEVVTMVFTALGEKQKIMASYPGTSKSWRRQAEAMGVTFFDLTPGDLETLERIFAEQWLQDLEKATPRTKEAWSIVKPFTTVK